MEAFNWMYFLFLCLFPGRWVYNWKRRGGGGRGGYKLEAWLYDFDWDCYYGQGKNGHLVTGVFLVTNPETIPAHASASVDLFPCRFLRGELGQVFYFHSREIGHFTQ